MMFTASVFAQDQHEVATQGKPLVMVLVQEKVMGVFGTTGWESPGQTELSIAQAFSNAGYPVIDSATVRANVKQSLALKMLEGDNKSAAFIAQKMGAQLVISGTAISKPAGAKLFGTQMKSIQATITARVIQKDDAKIIASGTETAAKVHTDEVQGGTLALADAANLLADKLLKQVEDTLSGSRSGIQRQLTLQITNLKNFPHLDNILYFFESKVKGVSAVYLREYKNAIADVALQYNGQSADLARQVAQHKFGGFRLAPTNVTSNRLDLVVVVNKR
jgi:hypothetical protein